VALQLLLLLGAGGLPAAADRYLSPARRG